VLAALALEEPDRVPIVEWSINARVRDAFSSGEPFGFEETMGLDGVVVYEDVRKRWSGPATYRDEWGITYKTTEEDYPASIDFPLKEPEQLAKLLIPDPHAEWRFETLRKAVERFGGRKAVFFRLRDGYSLPRYLRGMENLMADYLLEQDLARALVDLSVDFYLALAHHAMELGADVFWTSDDYCDNRGPVMGPDVFRQFVLPGLTRLVDGVRKEGYPFVKHCDGNIAPILPDLVGAGISCIDPIDVGAGVDLAGVKREFGGRVAIKGGVPIDTLVRGSPDDISRAVRRCCAEGGMGGGYILSSCSDVTAAVPPSNYSLMIDACRTYGSYPLQP
jgi:uroporphyrinogen decarboxylase